MKGLKYKIKKRVNIKFPKSLLGMRQRNLAFDHIYFWYFKNSLTLETSGLETRETYFQIKP